MIKNLVEITQLIKRFDPRAPPALDGIDAAFSGGKIIGLVGPDGAGKTTLIRLMAALLMPTSGTIKIAGYDTFTESSKVQEIIGYMPQKFGLYEDLTVIENLNLYADLQGISSAEKKERYETLLRFTDLTAFTKRLARDLSGGMKQKLGLACTLLRKPRFLLLDEPSVGVDPISRRELWRMVSELAKEGISILWSTAYLDEAEKCEEVLLLNAGKLLYQGPPEALTSHLKGRTFQIRGIAHDRRRVLTNALSDKRVIDGVIQGSFVRIVLRDADQKPDIRTFEAGDQAVLQESPPRFEDAFIDVLGGGPGGFSPLKELIPPFKIDGTPIVRAQGLTKKFGNFTAVDHVSFSVKRGEIFGLLGPNGAGKSTTFKMLCGLLQPTEGTAIIAGMSLQEAMIKARSRIGYMAQKFSLYGNMTVVQNLRFFEGIYHSKGSAIVNEMVEIFELKPYIHTTSALLPLGFKQRLALACAIMHHPEVLFLDEPTSGIDPITRREFWNHINAMVEKGIAIIVTTHFMDEAEYCDRIGLINEGKLIMIGSPDELKASVQSPQLPSPTLEDAFIILSTRSRELAHAQG